MKVELTCNSTLRPSDLSSVADANNNQRVPPCAEVCYIHQVWAGAGLQCPIEAAHDSQPISTGKAGIEDDLILLLQ